MRLTLAEFDILLDALKGSLRIAANGHVFVYTIASREKTLHGLISRMAETDGPVIGKED